MNAFLRLASSGRIAITASLIALLFAGCKTSDGPDLSPIGNGLGILGLCVVLAAFILALGDQWNKPKQ